MRVIGYQPRDLIGECRRTFRRFHLRGTPTTPSRPAERRGRPNDFGRQLRNGCRTVGWNSTRRRRGSSIAKMIRGREAIALKSPIFSAMNSGPESRSIATARSSPNSVPQSQPKLLGRCGRPSGADDCDTAVTSPLKDLSRLYNPIIRGWSQYYGRYSLKGFTG
jgi:Group II intron, maturase-specific domain